MLWTGRGYAAKGVTRRFEGKGEGGRAVGRAAKAGERG